MNCKYCKKELTQKLKEKPSVFKKRIFCGNECKMKWLADFCRGKKAHNNNQKERVCIWCGKKEMVSPVFAVRPYCSRNCMQKHYDSGILKGIKHWNWQGGITEIPSRDVLYKGYKEWRKKVYRRDGFKCVLCGENKSGQLQAHHIKPRASNKELILEVSNGLTVCKKCHKEIHYGERI